MPRFPASVDELSPELLSEVLAERHPGVLVSGVEILETSRVGDGQVSTADRVSLQLHYAPGRSADLPQRILLKTFLLQPHAPRSMYRNEVRFYGEIRPELEIETPRAYASAMDEENGQFGVLMEDLRLRSACFPNATTPVDVAQIRQLVLALATLHAQFWTSRRFQSDLAWLPTPLSGGMYKTFKTYGLALIRKQLEFDFKADLLRPLGRPIERLWDDLWRLQEILDSEPTTLLHGDPHIGNTYRLPNGAAGLLDWQLMVRGRWSHDLTYLLVTGLDIESRRKHERDLIAFYLDELRLRGVEAPSEEDAWLRHRQSVVWGLVIGWLITPPENYGEAITTANLRRLVAATQDLETFTAIA